MVVHLSFKSHHLRLRNTEMVFFSDETPVVYYGKDPSLLKFRATGTSKTYQRSDMCGPPASLWICFRNPGYIHDVLLTGLTPSIQYFYSYGSSEVCW